MILMQPIEDEAGNLIGGVEVRLVGTSSIDPKRSEEMDDASFSTARLEVLRIINRMSEGQFLAILHRISERKNVSIEVSACPGSVPMVK